MPSNAGHLRHRVTVQRAVDTRDASGGVIEEWRTIGDRWARVQPLRGRERYAAQQVNPALSHRITMRYTTAVSAARRIKLGDRIFHIEPPLNIDERGAWIEMMAREAV